MELFLYAFTALFSVMNPLGTVPVFVGLTQNESKNTRFKTSFYTALNALVILIISFYSGKYILSFFGISIESLQIAGGLIIASSGFALLTGSFQKHKGMDKQKVKADNKEREGISLTPLAIPMLAGPGTISLLISMQDKYHSIADESLVISALLLACILTYIILRSAHLIVNKLGPSGINAISRIIGFIVIAIGVEYVSSAVISLIHITF